MSVLGIKKYAIVANNITPVQREQIQAIIKANANGWWHNFADLWIVGGRNASEWRDLVGVAVLPAASAVLVLAVDTSDAHAWAYKGVLGQGASEWLRSDVHP